MVIKERIKNAVLTNTLFSKLNRLLLVMVLISFLSSLTVLFTIKRSYKEAFNDNFLDTVKLAVAFLEIELEAVSNMSLAISTDQKVQNSIRGLNSIDSIHEAALFRRSIEQFLYQSAFSKPYISVIEAEIPGYERIVVGRNLGIQKQNLNRRSLDEYAEYGGLDHYHSMGRGFLVNSREIRDISTLDFYPLGIMSVYLDVDIMMDYFGKRTAYLDHVDILVYCDGTLLNRKIEGPLPGPPDIPEEGRHWIFNERGKSYLAVYMEGNRDGIEYIALRDSRDYQTINSRLTRILVLTELLIVVLLLTGTRGYVRGITKPLESLSRKLSVFELNNFDITLDIPSSSGVTDEIRNLYQDVNIALRQIQNQVHEDYMMQMSLQDAQLNMLQSQMNPHFLYNTLDSIRWMAKESGSSDLGRMILALSRLMRHNLGEKRSYLPLRDELKFLDEYLFIQKIRYQEKLKIDYFIDPEALNHPVIPFLIQPLIENSIKYGVE
ncbi:MAG: histidine kinase, partial [Spirochaetales bacterium]|nr:histidine kinase [Spirochaetales bacterium]